MTDAEGKGNPVWRGPCVGANRHRRRSAVTWRHPTPVFTVGASLDHGAYRARHNVNFSTVSGSVDRRETEPQPGACNSHYARPRSICRQDAAEGLVFGRGVSQRGDHKPLPRCRAIIFKADKLSPLRVAEASDCVSVALADEPGVEVVSVQVDVAEPADRSGRHVSPVRSLYESCTVLPSRCRLGEGAGLAARSTLHRFGWGASSPGCPLR